MSGLIRCVFCTGVIGVYEPAIALGDGHARRTSIAREPDLGLGPEIVAHPICAQHAGHIQGIPDAPVSG